MKKNIVVLFLVFMSVMFVSAQDITGSWLGRLTIQGSQLRLVFNVSQASDGYAATMDSPDQGATGIRVTEVVFEDSLVVFRVASAGIEYKGVLAGGEIKGDFKQGTFALPMNLSKTITPMQLNRPDEPKAPFGYRTEDVTFQNPKAGVTLSGTLTMPETGTGFATVVLISGSGAQDRNEQIMGHKPFLVIADYLTRHGIAVLRYDDRGFGQSTGDYSTATSVDFADDVRSAMDYLMSRKEIDKRKVGLIGHSEGGTIAPMVAADNKQVSFIVLLAGVGIPGYELMLLQKRLIEEHSGYNQQQVNESADVFAQAYKIVVDNQIQGEVLKDSLFNYFTTASHGMISPQQCQALVDQLTTAQLLYFLRLDPAIYLSKVRCPILAVNGSKDLQVPAKKNLAAIKNATSRKTTIMEFENLNHLFQECSTGLPTEYGTIEQTFSPQVLEAVKNWIQAQ